MSEAHTVTLLTLSSSAGGIVALLLGIEAPGKTGNINIESFRFFASRAFVKRTGSKFPIVKYIVEAFNHSTYQTKGLNTVLKVAFGENRKLFGDTRVLECADQGTIPTVKTNKVGVTLTSSTGHPYFVANYNRPIHQSSIR
jgi:hypothetical protein